MSTEMSEHLPDRPDPVVPFLPEKMQRAENPVPDETGNVIIDMLRKWADTAKEDCARAMEPIHRLSRELRAAEDRAQAAEAEAKHFRERATTAEAWLLRIQSQIDESFFQKKKLEHQEEPSPPSPYAPPYARGGKPGAR